MKSKFQQILEAATADCKARGMEPIEQRTKEEKEEQMIDIRADILANQKITEARAKHRAEQQVNPERIADIVRHGGKLD